MAKVSRGPDSDQDGRRARDEHPAERAAEQVRETAQGAEERVAEERYPRRRVLRRGRVWLAVYVVALLALLALALAARIYSVLPGDLPFTRELQETRNPIIANVLTFISYIGFPTQSAIILILVTLGLIVFRLRLEAVFLLLTLAADGIGGLVKTVVNRSRPSPSLVHVVQRITSPSFPSGHTLHYVVFYGFLAFVFATSFRPSWGRNLLIAVCGVLIVLVGPSRVFLGEHWLTDVVGGYLLGGLLLVPIIAGYLWAKARFDSATLRRVRSTQRTQRARS
jgi:membrane-associated phospholipid phosphatase